MPESSTPAASQHDPSADETLTICAISIVGAILTNLIHEGVGHGLTALLTDAQSGLLTTVAWSSTFDSRLIQGRNVKVTANIACASATSVRIAKHEE